MLGDSGLALCGGLARALPLGGVLVAVEAAELDVSVVGRLLTFDESGWDFHGADHPT
ncbi:hypothetical protein ACH4VS_11455 [Streptomyces hygroscopicus]|uniref:hypothetical protein n=1 Tax=Streptomyces hygroscopicus TaxID=1912 RepID=UPI000AB01050|nr:hypothetical protein [Streptomyces hygroscopicus]